MSEAPDPFQRWPELDGWFERALETPPSKRGLLLEHASETDPGLGRELERLLAAHDAAAEFLEDPAEWLGELPAPPEPPDPATPEDPLTGRVLGHFELLDQLGEGGMGVVYKARDTKLDRLVALKFLHSPMQALPEAAERLFREARAASALDHPNICTIYEIDEGEHGRMYVAMAYYPGETLGERVARGEIETDEALEIGIEIGEGIARAHEAGIVHRDLKPANVMLTDRGEVKILDFGIAKLEGAGKLTRSGVWLGTVAYMSPEQATQDTVDHRTDIWSLGATLYELVSGTCPFEGATELATLDAILHEEPAPLSGMPAGLESVILTALAKEPSDRFASMSEMVEALRALRRGEPTLVARGADPRARPSRRWLIPAAAALIVGGAIGLLSRRVGSTADPVLAFPQGPSIAVVPFQDSSADPEQDFFADGLSEDLITGLARFSDLFVFSFASTAPYRARVPDIDRIRRELDVEYVLLGTVRRDGDRVRVNVRLLDASTESALWNETFNHDLSAAGLFEAQDNITEQVVGTLGGSAGVISWRRLAETRGRRTERLDVYQCVLRSYEYLNDHVPANHALARDCLERAVVLDSGYVDAWGWLAYMYAEESRHGWNRRDELYDPLDRALATAEHAARLEPANFMAQVGLAETRFDRHEIPLFYEAAERAMALNPNDATWLGVFGGHMVESGRWERGISIIDKARALNPNHPTWVYVDYFVNEFRKGEYEAALREALKINIPGYYRGYVCRIAAYGQLGRRGEARAAYERVLELRPDLVDEASMRSDLERYNHPDEFLERFFEGIRKSGIWDDG